MKLNKEIKKALVEAKEQKERRMHSTSYKVRKIYLLEGNNIKDFQFSIKTFESIIINTMIRDEIFIFNSYWGATWCRFSLST